MRLSLIFVISLFVISCANNPAVVKSTSIKIDSAKTIYITGHGWHTGLVVPAKDIQKRLPQLKERFARAKYIEFGWGDKGFYQAKKTSRKVKLLIQAMLYPTSSVLHTVGIEGDVRTYFAGDKIQEICLQPKQYSKLIAFIENSFYKNLKSKIIPLRRGAYGNSQFFQSIGGYYAMNTCNSWVAKGLSSAGMDISTSFKLTSGSIMRYLSKKQKNKTIYSCN